MTLSLELRIQALKVATFRLFPHLNLNPFVEAIFKSPPQTPPELVSRLVTAVGRDLSYEFHKQFIVFCRALGLYLGPEFMFLEAPVQIGNSTQSVPQSVPRLVAQLQTSKVIPLLEGWQIFADDPASQEQVSLFFNEGVAQFPPDRLLQIRKEALSWGCQGLLKATLVQLGCSIRPDDLAFIYKLWVFAFENNDLALMRELLSIKPTCEYKSSNKSPTLEEIKALNAMRVSYLYSSDLSGEITLSPQSLYLLKWAFEQQLDIPSLDCKTDDPRHAESLARILREFSKRESFSVKSFELHTGNKDVLRLIIPTILSTSISSLVIRCNSEEGFEHLEQSLNSEMRLKSLSIHNKKSMNAIGIKALAGFVEQNTNLRELILDTPIQGLVPLAKNRTLEELSLKLDPAVLKEFPLAEQIAATSIRIFDLSFNNLGDDQGEILVRAVQQHVPLHGLNLRQTGIGRKTILAACELLRTHPTFSGLVLWGNQADDADLEAIGSALVKNRSLEQLFISGVFSHFGLTTFASLLEKNPTLMQCKLGLEKEVTLSVDVFQKSGFDVLENTSAKIHLIRKFPIEMKAVINPLGK